MGKVVTVDVWGEDGQWFVAEGHVDLQQFKQAAASLLEDWGYDSELELNPQHRWWRPVTLHDCAGDAEEFNWKRGEGWRYFTDDSTEVGAEPVTVADVEE